MVFPVATTHLRAQPATWRGHSSIGVKNFSPPRPSDFTRTARDRGHMRNSFKRLSKISRQKPPRRSRHRKGREALEGFLRRGTSVNLALFRTATQLSALRTSCSLTLTFSFTTESAQSIGH